LAERPHVGSIMLTHEVLVPLAVFALLEHGCKEAHLMGDVVLGIEPGDPADTTETKRRSISSTTPGDSATAGPRATETSTR
jgi:hypothetical protein